MYPTLGTTLGFNYQKDLILRTIVQEKASKFVTK